MKFMTGSGKIIGIFSIIVVILGAGIGWYVFLSGDKEPAYDSITAEKRNLEQIVSVTGQVEPVTMVDLGFSTGGIVDEVSVEVGDSVLKGDVLVSLDARELEADLSQGLAGVASAKAQLEQYQALVEKEKATLADLQRGTRPEEITIQEVKVSNAIISLTVAKNDLLNALEDAYTKADDAVHVRLDVIFANQGAPTPTIGFSTTDSALETAVEITRMDADSILSTWRTALNALTVGDDLDVAADQAKAHLLFLRTLFDNASDLVSSALPNGSYTETVLDGYSTSISTGRANINTAFTNVLTEESGLTSAKATLSVEENQLALLRAGTTAEKLDAQKAAVTQAEANLLIQASVISEAEAGVAKTRTLLEKTILRSTIDGIVTDITPEIGESVSANTTLVSVITEEAFQVESAITETDIVLVQVGQETKITLDAYGDEIIFPAVVTKIDPAERVIEGLPTYNVTFAFNEFDPRIRSGMTANINIVTATKEQVVAIPQRAVLSIDGKRYVRVVKNNEIETVPVTLGIRGDDGRIEITSGVSVGDQIVTFLAEE